ncbi:MAG: ATP-binding protein [Clostridiales bacterium]|nr:ATP-binding protein [Clostridiales bacterium]MDY5468846.1 ATP-binding protein [Eubacteriales bacterium]
MKAMRIRRSLLVRALALMLAVFMLLFACLFALLYRSVRDTVRTQELQNASTRLEMFRAYLDLSLDNGRNTIYQFMQSGLMSSDEQDKIQAYFQRYSETNSVISVEFLLEGDRVLAIDQPLLLNSMTADSAFFYSQAQHNRLVISAPYYSLLATGRVVALIRSILVQCSRYSSQWSIYYLIRAEEFYARINAAIRQYVILIEDSGRGMTREHVERIFSDTVKNAVKNDGRGMVSIGLQNVRQRIEQFYGSGCSLYVRSREGIGTTVEVIIRNKQKTDGAAAQEG